MLVILAANPSVDVISALIGIIILIVVIVFLLAIGCSNYKG